MNMPSYMPEALRRMNEPVFARGFSGGLTRQDLFDPRNIACAAACSRKAGLVACLARCLATGEACDGGIDNCDRV